MTLQAVPTAGEFQPWARILGPETLTLPGGGFVRDRYDYRAWFLDGIARRGGQAWEGRRTVYARVNHGRWIVDCAWCPAAMLTRPEAAWRIAYCAECGACYGVNEIRYPDDWQAIEQALVVRVSRDQQHWDARQRLEDLLRENASDEVLTP